MVKGIPSLPPVDVAPITNYMKRKSDGTSLASPTGETASPEKQKQKATTNSKSPSNKLTPREESPQRDKSQPSPREARPPQTNRQERSNEAPTQQNTKAKESEHDKERVEPGNSRKVETIPEKQIPQRAEEKGLKPEDFPPLTRSEKNETPAKSKADLKQTFLEKAKAAQSKPEPLLPQWKAHRLACMFTLEQPDNNNERITAIATELNKMLLAVKVFTEKVFVRKFEEHFTPRAQEKRHWISQFDKAKASDLLHYTHGFLAWVAPRGGVQRLLVQVVVPVATNIPDMLFDVNNSSWASKNGRRLYNIKEQALYAPRPVGWLFRSNHTMASSDELQRAFERRGGIDFGLTFKTVPVPGQKYNKDTAVKAVCISTNERDVETAWRLLSTWYNSERPVYPLAIPMVFVPAQSHPHINNNPHAAKNISTLLERQKIFINDTMAVPCPTLADPDESTPTPGGRKLRNLLMDVTVTTMGDDYRGAKLFHSISKKTNPNGNSAYFFTFHKSVEKEARSVISGLGQFIRAEWKINPDPYCYVHMIDDTQKWNKKTRSLSNPTTTFLDKITMGDDEDDDGSIPPVGELFTMNEKQKRESRRILGLKDDETVTDVTKKQSPKSNPRQDRDDVSRVSEISGLTQYSNATAASKERKSLRAQVQAKAKKLEEQEAEIARLTAELEKRKQELNVPSDSSSAPSGSSNSTGEDTAESPNVQNDGWEADPNYDELDDDTSTDGTYLPKAVVDLSQKDSMSDTEENDDTSESDFYADNGKQIPYLAMETGKIDGLEFIYRGAPAEIEELKKLHKDDPYPLVETDPFNFSTDLEGDSWVELYRVTNKRLFSKTVRERRKGKRTSCVRFSPEVRVKEINPQGTLGEEKEIDIEEESALPPPERGKSSGSITEEDKEGYDSDGQLEESQGANSISPSSQNSSDSSEPPVHNRPSNITKETINDAIKEANTEIIPTNTHGGGPEEDE